MTGTVAKLDTDELLNELMLENHITLKDVYTCAERHKNEIMEMMDIFEHENDDDRRLSLELLGLLAQDQGDKVMEFYHEEYGFAQSKPLCGNFPREDVELLLAACLYNPTLLSFALSVSEDIKSRLAVRLDEEPETVEASANAASGYVIIWTFRFPDRMKRSLGSTPGFKEFFNKHISHNNIDGELKLMENSHNQVYLEFEFAKPQDTINFELEFCFTTTIDSKDHRILVNKRSGNEVMGFTSISSGTVDGVDCTDGIENCTVNFLLAKTN